MLIPRSIKKIILYLGAGPRTDIEISDHLGIDETQLMNAMTGKPYKDFFHAEHRPNASRLTLTELGWEMRDAIRQEIRDRRLRRFSELRYWITTAIAAAAFIRAFFL